MPIPGFGWLQSIVLYKLGRRPLLHVKLRSTGGSTGGGIGCVDFVAVVSNGGPLAAIDCSLVVELEGVGPVHEQTLSLRAGEIDREIRFKLDRPKYGDLVQELDNAATLYGRALTARISCGPSRAAARWEEETYNPVTDAARFAAQQAAWDRGRPLAGG